MIKEKSKKGWIIGIVIVVIIAGFAAGIGGQIFTRYYLSQFSFFRDISLISDNINGQEIVISQPKKVVVEQEMQVEQIISDIGPSVVSIFKIKKVSGTGVLDKILTQSERLSLGFVLTSDGWLVVPAQIADYKQADLAVVYKNKTYSVQEIIADDLLNTAFIKIDSQNLPVINLAKKEEIALGQNVILYDSLNQQLKLNTIDKINYQNTVTKQSMILSTEEYNDRILLAQPVAENFFGVPAVNLGGAIIGLCVENNNRQVFVPINYIKAVMDSILAQKQAKHLYLGLKYINLSSAIGLEETFYQNLSEGAIVYSVSATSPLASQLKTNDIIYAVENQNISSKLSLMDLLLQYRLGDQIKIKFRRDGEDKEASFTLNEIK